MNFYEELGITPSASISEIRQAYKEMVRLLHPDRQQDEGLRRAAERQIKRLNAILAVLSDPESRHLYDMSLADCSVPPVAGEWALARVWGVPRAAWMLAAEWLRRSWLWLAAVGIAGAGLAFYMAGHEGARELAQREAVKTRQAPGNGTNAAQSAAHPSREPAFRTRSAKPPREEQARVAMAPGPQEGEPEAGFWSAESISSPAVEVRRQPPPEFIKVEQAAPEAASAAPLVSAVAPLPAPERGSPPEKHDAAPVASGLAGTWLYVPPQVPERQEALYPPEYIELRITEEPGLLFGRYRARYRVTDRTLWPEVHFEFEGKPAQETYNWRGIGGGRGEVRLKQLRADLLEVSWWANRLGEKLRLASGTAVLIRMRAGAQSQEGK